MGGFFCLVGSGHPHRRILLAILIGLWGFRLTVHLWKRLSREGEDGRYESYRREKGQKAADRFYLIFFQMQAVFALIFASPILVASYTPAPSTLGLLDSIGVAIWIFALCGESLADLQLERFRSVSNNKGEVCRVGLWSWSRHPNYFFEWLHWFAYVLIGWHGAWGYLTLIGPVAMLLFLFRFTGIPITEKQALRSRGEKYRKYQQEVSAFFPYPPRKKENGISSE
jgi:steroid 5-alpha reductase family enzyme